MRLEAEDAAPPLARTLALIPNLYKYDNRGTIISPNHSLQVKGQANGSLVLSEIATGKELASLIALDDKDWVQVTRDGRFDTSKSLDRIEGLHWSLPDDPLRAFPLEIFMRQYFEPGLFRRNLSGERLKPLPHISQINRVQPTVAIKSVDFRPGEPHIVDVTVAVTNTREVIARGDRREQLDSGVYDLRLFRDGQMVMSSTPLSALNAYLMAPRGGDDAEADAWRKANDLSRVVKFDAAGSASYTFRGIKLPRWKDVADVELSAYAFNADRVKSQTASWVWPGDLKAKLPRAVPVKPTAYLVSFGVNSFRNPSWNLSYAANDAREMRRVLSWCLQERRRAGEYEEVVEVELVSDDKGDTATKANIRTIFQLLAGEEPAREDLDRLGAAAAGLRKAEPEDTIVVTLSSHGYADARGLFYILPSDIRTSSQIREITNDLLASSISSDELSLWLRPVDAGTLVMIVDACHSATAIEGSEFKPGPMGSRGLGQLAYDKGMRVLAATRAEDAAIEVGGSISQGLLSFALVKEGLEDGMADFSPPDDQKITVGEWLRFGVERVPVLYRLIESGELNVVSRDFLVDEDPRARRFRQQPTLFDFAQRVPDPVLARGGQTTK